ncbi:siderophore-interacting protein [Sphingomonas sp. BK069]|uniref:siderophore-interacting protein n=1 Tax=Sphingomonas sp. BK069 TaxID=2586979 RepID=UPI0016144C9B|nr:siderophore-interacting protein [Sphingomonas sp. BK069]MBB3349714.1 NADPH-dependent ferric siderophore reductase [Sphingomonas sp. BK069]
MRRVTFGSEDFCSLRDVRPGQWMKLFFGEGAAGRAYTIRAHRPEAGEIDIDFVLHGEAPDPGPAASWIRKVSLGCRVRLYGPRSDFRHDPKRRLCLFGDECALPAICVILESLPRQTSCIAIVEGADRPAIGKLCQAASLINSSVVQTPDRRGEGLLAVGRNLPLSPDWDQIWVGCESATARRLRAEFAELGFERRSLHVSGYWKRGVSDHVDSDGDY